MFSNTYSSQQKRLQYTVQKLSRKHQKQVREWKACVSVRSPGKVHLPGTPGACLGVGFGLPGRWGRVGGAGGVGAGMSCCM